MAIEEGVTAASEPELLSSILNSPIFWVALIFVGIMVVLIWLITKYKKSDKTGQDIFIQIVQKDVKSILKVFGISSKAKMYHGLNHIAVVKKYCLNKSNLEKHRINKDGKMKDLSENVAMKISVSKNDFNFYLMKCCKRGFINGLLALLGMGTFFMLIQKELVFLREGKIYIDGNLSFDEFGKVWILAQADTSKVILNMYWRNNYETILGEIAEVPRKIAYLETALGREVEKTEKTIEAIETGKRSKMKKFF